MHYCRFLILGVTMSLLLYVVAYADQPPDIPIGSFYFETANETEIWITIVPDLRQGKLKPLQLNFAARFPGKSMAGPPLSVTLTAILNSSYVPGIQLQPVARVSLDGENLDLKPGPLFGPCDENGCAYNRIAATIPALTFQRIVKAQTVEGSAMGILFSLSPEQLEMLRSFINHLKLLPRSRP
jgi:hypothetical protein